MQDTADRDERTTPPWARPFALVFLYALVVYFQLCFYYDMKDDDPWWTAYGSWQMFTTRGARHGALDAEALIDGEWRPFDLEPLFPTRWDSGPRYARSSFRANTSLVRTLADSACDRHPDKPERVRLTDVSWPVTIGEREQPRNDAKRTVRIDWKCSETARRPKGTVW